MSETGITGVPMTGTSSSGEGMTGAQSLIRSLESAGATDIFGIPGGAILPAYDPLMDSTKVRHILVRHEQGAGHAAEGYAAATGQVGVCMATSGPGATNLVTPLADAHMDSVPDRRHHRPGRASAAIGTDAFQEADIRGITMPITKHNYLVTDPRRHPAHDRRGLPHRLHRPPRPGPGRHRQGRPAGRPRPSRGRRARPARLPPGDPPARQADPRGGPADRSRRGARCSTSAAASSAPRACQELRELAELTGIPVVTTLMARGAFPDSHPLHLGMPGMHGTVAAVTALQKSDLLISLGARFDDRVTGQPRHLRARRQGHPRRHRPGRDRQEPARRRADRRRLPARSSPTSSPLLHARGRRRPRRRLRRPGVDAPGGLASDATRSATTSPTTALAPQYVIERLGAIAGPDAIYVAGRRPAPDVGRPVHRLREARHLAQLRRPRHHGLRRAGRHGRQGRRARATVWAIDGDGCFQMTNQELATCAINDIPIKVAIINNAVLGMVRQWQTLFYNERYSNTDLHSDSGSPTSSSSPRPTAASACAASARRTSTPPSRRRWRSTTARSSSTSSSTGTRWCGRWSPPAPATTRSRYAPRPGARVATEDEPADEHSHTLSVLVENKPGVLARIAGLFSPARLQHRLASRSARPSTPRSPG